VARKVGGEEKMEGERAERMRKRHSPGVGLDLELNGGSGGGAGEGAQLYKRPGGEGGHAQVSPESGIHMLVIKC
jgi:hypothetical protein